jgi:hypothetical protein
MNRMGDYIEEDMRIVENVLKFEKLFNLENDYNCRIFIEKNH